ncbi:reverse transcriptase domain-containing protein [Pseudomonas coleopterorum]|uniref:reverse transcriptase domain-containing protein n=1 Tax=Pseudomonas coleopterorum TaxID=1605838 RepID=UPI002A6B1909|nr:reverse transcriptase domain-containing protein [Pseudomonas coleopterorum]MDY1019525.1 reverse transcriptase domain-containing protein [Pseudomonas coleopterorum]
MESLHSAWRKVKSSALTSSSESIRNEAKDFESRLPKSLSDIQRALSKKTFTFQQQTGVAKTKANGNSRPIVLSPIPNRIVQRALLDVMQSRIKFVKEALATPTSYGGIQNKRVAMAVTDAKQAISKGAAFHTRSDIAEFFTRIDKARVMALVVPHIKCPDTVALFQAAITTDLANIDVLRRQGLDDIFPLGVEGVAQGSPLSPLIANLYLHDFDKTMNDGEVICLRYIDDFLILGKDMGCVDRAFNKAQSELKKLSLHAYQPSATSDKASRGLTADGFDFLGCFVSAGLVQPSKTTRERFKKRIKADLDASIRVMKYSVEAGVISPKGTYSGALQNLDRVILGWGKAFSFCSNGQWIKGLDDFITGALAQYEVEKTNLFQRSSGTDQRRMLGVRLLSAVHLERSEPS